MHELHVARQLLGSRLCMPAGNSVGALAMRVHQLQANQQTVLESKLVVLAGLFYWVDIVMRFLIGFVVVYNLKRELILDGGLIAHFYIRHNTFATDLIAAIPAVAEVHTTTPSFGQTQDLMASLFANML